MVTDWDGLIAAGRAVLEGNWSGTHHYVLKKQTFVNEWTAQVCDGLHEIGLSHYANLIANESALSSFYLTTTGLRRDTRSALGNRLAMLESVLDRLSPNGKGAAPTATAASLPAMVQKRVFLVHGHDEAAREKVARFLERCELEPIILHEQANRGHTIIEKFEAHSKVGFAVVLLTPDDLVGDERRARQNVIFEMGYFAGKMGRRHVAALVADGVDIPSDLHGVVYIPLDHAGAWRFSLARELREAGLSVDAERILS